MDTALSELEELWLPSFKRSLANRNTNLKLFNIAVPSVYPHNPKTISITIMLTGLWLSVDSFLAVDRSSGLRFSGPYPDAKTNKGLFMLKLLVSSSSFPDATFCSADPSDRPVIVVVVWMDDTDVSDGLLGDVYRNHELGRRH